MLQLGWQLSGTLSVCSGWNLIGKYNADSLYRSRYRSSRCSVSSVTYQRRNIQNDRLWNASSLCYNSSIHSILTYISFFLRLEIKRSQIILTPTSMSHTSITSQHHIFLNLDLMNLIVCRMLCRKDFVPITPGIVQPFICYDLIDMLIPSDQDSAWVTITHLVKCTLWTITNGFPVPVKIYLKKKKGGLLTII